MRLTVLILALTIAAPSVATTDVGKRYTKEYNECMTNGDAAQGITSAMRECTSLELERQDGRLNQAYVMVMNRLGAAGKAKLRSAQRAWINVRDRTCDAAGKEYDGGTFAPIAYMSCKTDETIKRTLWLERYR
jgi:uncharacterized protein YecT (DUF1311 family)